MSKIYIVTMDYPGKNVILGAFTDENKATRFFQLKKSSLKGAVHLHEMDNNDDQRLMHESIIQVFEDGSFEVVFSDYIMRSEPMESEFEWFHEQSEINEQEETGLFAVCSIHTVSRSNNVRVNFENVVKEWEERGGWKWVNFTN